MAEIVGQDITNILNVFCQEYNKLHQTNFLKNDVYQSFNQGEVDVDIRLISNGCTLDIQVVRAFGDNVDEYERPALLKKISAEIDQEFHSEGLCGDLSWSVCAYPKGSKVKPLIAQLMQYVKKKRINNLIRISSDEFQVDAPIALRQVFKDFEFTSGTHFRQGYSWSSNAIDPCVKFLNAVKSKEEGLTKDRRRHLVGKMVLIVYFDNCSFDDYYLKQIQASLNGRSTCYGETWVCQNHTTHRGAYKIS